MRVLLTGSFGNIGESTLIALLDRGHQVRCFDLHSESTKKKCRKLAKSRSFETQWGNILDPQAVQKAVEGRECIIHLAAIIPPLSEANPDLARQVNIEGTKNIIVSAEALDPKPKLIFPGSISTFGPTMHREPPRTADDPLIPTDVYTHTKCECERLVKASKLPWTILRFGAVPPLEISSEIDPMLFEIPLDQRIEFVHTLDVGVACANAVTADTVGKILLIGGGKVNQLLQRDFVSALLEAMGIGMLPDSAFKVAKKSEDYYYTDWLDTEESQRLLQYQTRTFDQYIEEFKKIAGFKRHLARLFRGSARKRLLKSSPYYSRE